MAGSHPEDLTQARRATWTTSTTWSRPDPGHRRIARAATSPVPGTLNFRDAGGYPTADGGVTAWRRLLRSDGLHRLDQGAGRRCSARSACGPCST